MRHYEREERDYGRERRGIEWDRSDYGRARSGRNWRSPDLRQERRGYDREYPDREWEYQGHEWDQPGYERLGPEHDWDQPGYGGERQGYQWERQGGYDPQRQERAGQPSWRSAGQYGDGSYRGRGPKGYQRSDERIREDVCEALTWHPWIDASEIDVSVHNGQVSLQGTVETRQMKRMAEECVETIFGVIDVENHIRLARSAQHHDQARTAQQGGHKPRS